MVRELFDIETIDFESCTLKEILTIVAYLIVNSTLDETSLIDKCVLICTQKLNDSLKNKEDLTTEYFYLLDILKKKKRSFSKEDEKREYIRKLENTFKNVNLYTLEEHVEKRFAKVLKEWLNDESCFLFIRTLIEKDRRVVNTRIDGKHIVLYILDEYIKNFKIMLKNRNREYINKDYLREIYYLFTKSYYVHLTSEEKSEIDKTLNEFIYYIKKTIAKEYRKNAAIKEINSLKSENFYKYINEYVYPKYNDDAMNYEVARITSLAKADNNTIDVFLFRDRAYKLEGNKLNIYVMDISPYTHEKSIMYNYLEYLEYEKVNMDEFVFSNLSFKVGNSYKTICYTLSLSPSGIVTNLDVSKQNIRITHEYKSFSDFDSVANSLYELYKKSSLKYNGSYASFDLLKINDYFDSLVTSEYIKFAINNKLPFLYHGYKQKSEKEITDCLNEYINLLNDLSKQDARTITNIITSRIDKSHYSLIPLIRGVYDVTLTDHKNYLSILNQEVLHNIYFNDYLLSRVRLNQLRKTYVERLMNLADDLNRLNDYVDEDMIRVNKGKIKRKVNIPSLT